jgi:hypothetical protein
MAIILLALVGYLFFVEFPQEQKKQEADLKAQKVLSLDEAAVKALKIRYPDREIQLEKTPEHQWWITSPLVAEADDGEVKRLVSTIAEMRLTRIIEDQNQDPAPYGFDHPQVEVTLTLENIKDSQQGDKQEKIILGDNGPVLNTLYIKRGSDQRVVLVDQGVKSSLILTLSDLRNKTVLPMDRNKVTELKLDFQKQSLLFAKEGEQWMIKQPKAIKADNSTISRLLLTLENLRATGFVDLEREKTKTRNRFKGPELILSLKEEGENPTVSFYRTGEKGHTFAVTVPERPIYQVPDAALNDFPPDLFHYQDKHLLLFEQEKVKEIEVKTPSESYRLKQKDRSWTVEGEAGTVDQEAVNRFFNSLKFAEAQRQPDPPILPEKAGLAPSTTHIQLMDSEGQTLARLEVGSEAGGLLYTRGIPELGITLINKNILDNIPKKSELIKPQKKEGKD